MRRRSWARVRGAEEQERIARIEGCFECEEGKLVEEDVEEKEEDKEESHGHEQAEGML